MVEKLLTLGATANATEKRGQTPLHRACERGRLDVVRCHEKIVPLHETAAWCVVHANTQNVKSSTTVRYNL